MWGSWRRWRASLCAVTAERTPAPATRGCWSSPGATDMKTSALRVSRRLQVVRTQPTTCCCGKPNPITWLTNIFMLMLFYKFLFITMNSIKTFFYFFMYLWFFQGMQEYLEFHYLTNYCCILIFKYLWSSWVNLGLLSNLLNCHWNNYLMARCV